MSGSRPWPLRLVLCLYWAALVTASHWPNLRLQMPDNMGGSGSTFGFGLPIDKMAHLGAFTILAWLALMANLFQNKRKPHLWTLALVVLYSAVDEWTQQFTGREVHLNDWFASTGGICLGTVAWIVTDWLSNHDDSFVGHTKIVSAMTTLSRMFGLVRDWALALAFGLSGVMDAFIVAFMIPNLFRRLFGEGALAAAFVPCYSKLKNQDMASATRFATDVLKRLTIGLVAVVAVAVAVLWVVRLNGELGDRSGLTVDLSMILLWFAPMICATAIAGAVLQVHGRFGPPAAAPIILNIAMIGAAIYAAFRMGHHGALSKTTVVAVAVLAAGAVQLAWQWTLLPRTSGPGNAGSIQQARKDLGKAWAPTIVGMAVFQLNVLADAMIAMGFSADAGATLTWLGQTREFPMQVGDVSALSLAQRLYQFPLGVFGIAIATAIFPALSAASEDRAKFSQLLRQGLRLTIFIGLPASVGLWLVRDPLTRVIFYEGGALKAEDAGRIAHVLAAYAPSVWAYSMTHVLTRSFYAQHNPRTPMRVAIAVVALNITLNLTLIWYFGVAGLAWSTTFCSMVHALSLLVLVRRYVQKPIDGQVIQSWIKITLLSALMAVVVASLGQLFDLQQLGRGGSAGVLFGLSLAGAMVILVGSKITKMAEPSWLLRGTLPKSSDASSP